MEFGAVSRAKQWLVRRWLINLPVLTQSDLPTTAPTSTIPDPDLVPFESKTYKQHKGDLGAVEELLTIATPVAIAELDPTAASRLQQRVPVERLRSLSPRSRKSNERSESQGSTGSGVMVEERVGNEEEEEEREGEGEIGGVTAGRDGGRGGRLGVPR